MSNNGHIIGRFQETTWRSYSSNETWGSQSLSVGARFRSLLTWVSSHITRNPVPLDFWLCGMRPTLTSRGCGNEYRERERDRLIAIGFIGSIVSPCCFLRPPDGVTVVRHENNFLVGGKSNQLVPLPKPTFSRFFSWQICFPPEPKSHL